MRESLEILKGIEVACAMASICFVVIAVTHLIGMVSIISELRAIVKLIKKAQDEV